jgi:protein SCO1/2
VAFLLLGPRLDAAPWVDRLLIACFGWSADTRRYRLDALILVLLQPPLFAAVVFCFFRDECLDFLRSRAHRLVAAAAPLAFVTLGASLLATSEISASGVAPTAGALPPALRQGAVAPPFRLVDHRGRSVSLDALRGRAVIMTFAYTSCHASCPILIERLKSLEARVQRDDVAFVTVSLDPERDDERALAAAAAHWNLGERWHLLSGEPAAVRTLLLAYRVQWARLPDGDIAHENVVVLIDRRGRLGFTYRGLAYSESQQEADLRRLLAERS